MIRARIISIVLLCVAGCASQQSAVRLSDDARLNAFLEDVREEVEGHAWDQVLAWADSAHYRIQVLEHGMSEPQYVAELFGVHMVDNDIGDGEPIEWTHLNRIESLRINALEGSRSDGWEAQGLALLNDGSRLNIRMHITSRNGAYRLTGALG